MVLLGALLLLPVAGLIQTSARSTADTAAGNTAVLAATSAAVAAASTSAGSGGADTQTSALTAACEAMDDYLPARILSVTATGDTIRVTVSTPSRTGRTVTHSFSASRALAARGGGVFVPFGAGTFEASGAALAASNPACVGRAG